MKTILAAYRSALVPVALWGPPGIGKSALVRAMAASDGVSGVFIEISCGAVADAADLTGYQVQGPDGRLRLALPDWREKIIRAGGGTIFIDEVGSCPSDAIEAAVMRLVHDDRPAGTWVVLAGNGAGEGGVGRGALSAASASRMGHVFVLAADTRAGALAFLRAAGGARRRIAMHLAMLTAAVACPATWTVAGGRPTWRTWDLAGQVIDAAGGTLDGGGALVAPLLGREHAAGLATAWPTLVVAADLLMTNLDGVPPSQITQIITGAWEAVEGSATWETWVALVARAWLNDPAMAASAATPLAAQIRAARAQWGTPSDMPATLAKILDRGNK